MVRSRCCSAVNSKYFSVLVTGTSVGGIGFEAARVIAKYANLVIITGHNADRLIYCLLSRYLLTVGYAD
jgi:short-subunit dehydrogenase involved in D-alanine esterification of teichoic acids